MGLPSAMRCFDLRFVELEARLAQAVAHAQRALLAVGEELALGRSVIGGPVWSMW